MREEDIATMKDAAKLENRSRVLRLTLKDGEILLAKALHMPCECGECDDLVIYEHVWSSAPERNKQWHEDKTKNVGGYAIPLSWIEKAEVSKI